MSLAAAKLTPRTRFLCVDVSRGGAAPQCKATACAPQARRPGFVSTGHSTHLTVHAASAAPAELSGLAGFRNRNIPLWPVADKNSPTPVGRYKGEQAPTGCGHLLPVPEADTALQAGGPWGPRGRPRSRGLRPHGPTASVSVPGSGSQQESRHLQENLETVFSPARPGRPRLGSA